MKGDIRIALQQDPSGQDTEKQELCGGSSSRKPRPGGWRFPQRLLKALQLFT